MEKTAKESDRPKSPALDAPLMSGGSIKEFQWLEMDIVLRRT